MGVNDQLQPGDYAQTLACSILSDPVDTVEDYLTAQTLGEVHEGTFCMVLESRCWASNKEGKLFKILVNLPTGHPVAGWVRNIDIFAASREPPTYRGETRRSGRQK